MPHPRQSTSADSGRDQYRRGRLAIVREPGPVRPPLRLRERQRGLVGSRATANKRQWTTGSSGDRRCRNPAMRKSPVPAAMSSRPASWPLVIRVGPRFDAATSISGFPPSAPQRAELRHLSYAPVVSDHDGNARLALARGRHLASTSCGPVAASCGCGDCRLCKRARRAAALPLSRESKRPGRPAPAARRFCFVAKAVTTTRLPVLAGSRHVCRARNVAGIGALRQRHEQAVGQ